MPDKKTILFVSTKSVWGGAQKYVHDLAVHLPKEQFDVIVAAGGTGPLKEKIEAAGLRYIVVKNFERDVRWLKELRAFFELLKLFRNLKPDIIHLNGSKAGAMGAVAGRLACINAKIIYSTHGLPYFEERPLWQRFFIYLTLKFTAFFLDRAIAISRHDYETAMRHRLISPKKLVFIPISINPMEYWFLPKNKAKSAIFDKAGIRGVDNADGIFVVGTIAEYTKNKGLSYLIDALKGLQAVSLPRHGNGGVASKLQTILIGWGEEKEKLKAQIKRHGLENTVFLVEGAGEDYKYLKAFDIFVLPSIKEGLPYTLLEAALAEVPVVATRAGGSPEIVEHKKTGLLVKPKAREELSSAIAMLAKNAELRHKYAERARKKVLNDFSLSTMLERTCVAYNKNM